ncbi:unnamed protein product [Caenorhabditis nigoni]
MSLYHSVTVNSDSQNFEPVIVEVSNFYWKMDYYHREKRKKVISFVFSMLVISGCVAGYWTYGKEDHEVVRSSGEFSQLLRDPPSGTIPETTRTLTTKPIQKITTTTTESWTSTIPFCPERVVAYYSGTGHRDVSNIDFSKLSHLIFSHLLLDLNGNVSFRHEHQKLRFLELKEKARRANNNIKFMVSIEEDGVGFQFSKVAGNAEKRKIFFNSFTTILQNYELDGIDIIWMHPYREDLANQVTLIQELREHLDRLTVETKKPYVISLVAPALGSTLGTNLGENIKNILEYVDFLNIRSFDYWKFSTVASAPLFSKTGPNVNDTISYYIRKSGGKVELLNLGLEFSGTFLNDVDSMEHQRGKVFWRNLEKEGWKDSMWDPVSQTPYIRMERKYLSFENPQSLSKKMEYFNKQNLGGLAIWSLEMDDDKNTLLGAVSSCGYNQ